MAFPPTKHKRCIMKTPTRPVHAKSRIKKGNIYFVKKRFYIHHFNILPPYKAFLHSQHKSILKLLLYNVI